MNCETIDSILDDHRVARLTGAERQRAAEHMSGCARCSGAWAADDALRGEAIADPAPEAFPTLLRRVTAAPVPTQQKAAVRGRWSWLAGVAAASAVAAIAPRLATIEPEASPPPASSRIDEQVIERAQQPGARIRDGAEVAESRPRAQANLLNEILRVGTPPREPHRSAIQRREMRLHQACELLLDRRAHRRRLVLCA